MSVTKPRTDNSTPPDSGNGRFASPASAALANGQIMDGRRLRSEKSRRRIVDATLQLVREGQAAPSAEAVAERADVGLRSVFRHFRDMDSLYAQLADAAEAELRAELDLPLDHPDWPDRLEALAERRCQAFEQVMPILNAISLHRLRDPEEGEDDAAVSLYLHNNLREALPGPVRKNGALTAALNLALGFQSWRALRQEQKLTFRQAQTAVKMTVNALLAQHD